MGTTRTASHTALISIGAARGTASHTALISIGAARGTASHTALISIGAARGIGPQAACRITSRERHPDRTGVCLFPIYELNNIYSM